MLINLLNKIDIFFKYAKDLSNDNPKNLSEILSNLSKIDSFKSKIKYAEKYLKRLSSGSSRVIFTLPNKKEVIKVAKNERGVAQNKAESKINSYLVNKTLKYDKDGNWKISPFLDKISEKEFEKLLNINFKDFGAAIDFALKVVSGNSAKKPKNYDEIEKNKFFKDLVDLSKKHDLMPGDIKRISSWGKLNNKPILLDAGLTKKIFDKFYD